MHATGAYAYLPKIAEPYTQFDSRPWVVSAIQTTQNTAKEKIHNRHAMLLAAPPTAEHHFKLFRKRSQWVFRIFV